MYLDAPVACTLLVVCAIFLFIGVVGIVAFFVSTLSLLIKKPSISIGKTTLTLILFFIAVVSPTIVIFSSVGFATINGALSATPTSHIIESKVIYNTGDTVSMTTTTPNVAQDGAKTEEKHYYMLTDPIASSVLADEPSSVTFIKSNETITVYRPDVTINGSASKPLKKVTYKKVEDFRQKGSFKVRVPPYEVIELETQKWSNKHNKELAD